MILSIQKLIYKYKAISMKVNGNVMGEFLININKYIRKDGAKSGRGYYSFSDGSRYEGLSLIYYEFKNNKIYREWD